MNDGKIILSIKVSEYIVQAQSIINQFITTLLLIKKKKKPNHAHTDGSPAPTALSEVLAGTARPAHGCHLVVVGLEALWGRATAANERVTVGPHCTAL